MRKLATTGMLTSSMMTPIERAHGRFMRAPDHDAGSADAGAGASGGDNAGSASEAGAAADAGASADTGTLLGEAAADAGTGDTSANADAKPSNSGTPVPDDVPETYELKLTVQNEAGEEIEQALDPKLIEAATPVFKDLGLSNDKASKLLKLVPEVQARTLQTMMDNHATEVANWAKQVQADPEIGGDKLPETQRLAAKALDHFTGPAVTKDGEGNDVPNEFRTLLNESGLGNHPVMLRTFSKIGAAMSEDGTFVRNTNEQQPKKTREATLYPEDVPAK